MADKRKAAQSNKTPAKKRKVETTKKTPASAKKAKTSTPKKVTKTPTPKKVTKTPTPKKVTSTKVKKPEPKKTPKTPAKVVKTPLKVTKSAKTPVKTPTAKPVLKKDVIKTKLAAKAVTRTKLEKTKAANIKAKLDRAKALKIKAAAAAKAKLKTTKSAAKPKAISKAPVKPKPKIAVKAVPERKTPAKKIEVKQSEEKKEPQKKAEEKKATPKPKADKKETVTESATKRKNANQEVSTEAPRKRRMITPNKKFADFELDVPSKRTITPNKKYADFETDTSSKKVSELRAFIQDKKKSPVPETPSSPEKSTKSKNAAASAKKSEKDAKKETPAREIKVFKPSEMKPAEKLMKKLQKKLEKEAKSGSTPKPVDNREKAKIKITKVVTYDKPMSSDEKEMRALKQTPKSKTVSAAKTVTGGVNVKTPRQTPPKTNITKAAKATPKATPKSKAPEKPAPKPKKIKEIPRAERPIQAKFICQKNIKYKDDNDQLNCWVTGISVYPSGEIIMVDMTNRKIKLFSKDFDFLSQVKLDTIPQDISVSPVNVSDAYFTKPFSKEGIQKVTMSDGKLTLKESFWTNGTNRGITCTKSGILTSVQDGRYHDLDINHFKIDLLDYDGKVLQSVSTDSNGSRLFKLPLYFTVNNTGKQMIVADCIKHFSYVVSVDMSGKIKFKYEGIGGNLVTPRGLTIDDEDNIYVTEWERHNVYVLSPTGKRVQVLFNHQELREDGLDGLNKPYQLCFYKENDTKKLIVSQEGCNTVKIFQVYKRGPESEEPKQAVSNAVTEKKDLPNGEASPTKSKAVTARKNGSQAKTSTIVKNVAAEVKKTTVEEVKEKVDETKEVTENVKVSEMPSPVKEISENGSTALDMAEPMEASAQTDTEKEENPPVLNPEFVDDFDTTENEVEENSSVQDAINSLNDSKEEQTVTEAVSIESNVEDNLDSGVDADQVQVEVYEQISVPNVETVETQHEIAENMNVQQGEVEVPEAMDVQQVELVNTQYEQVLIPQEEIITTQSVDTEIQSMPIESIGHETIIIQQDVNQMNTQQYEKIETVTMNNNDASNLIQTEVVQYVTDVSMPDNYATNIAQSEIVTTEVPEEIVTMVTETV